jgi:phage shock protein A
MATKAAYQAKLKAQLNEWDAKIDVWNAKAATASATARIRYENELESLADKRASARKMLDTLGKRTDAAWEEMKEGAEKMWHDMGKSIDKLASHFS